jgi:SHS2 domain-containing protein
MPGTFTFLEHTADVGIVTSSDTLDEALAWAAKGMFSAIADLDRVCHGNAWKFR